MSEKLKRVQRMAAAQMQMRNLAEWKLAGISRRKQEAEQNRDQHLKALDRALEQGTPFFASLAGQIDKLARQSAVMEQNRVQAETQLFAASRLEKQLDQSSMALKEEYRMRRVDAELKEAIERISVSDVSDKDTSLP